MFGRQEIGPVISKKLIATFPLRPNCIPFGRKLERFFFGRTGEKEKKTTWEKMEKKGREIPDVLLVFFHQQCFWPFLPRPPFLLAMRLTVIWAKCNSELFFPDAVVSCHIARCYWGTVPKNKISAGKCRVTRKYCAKNMKARRPRARHFNWK